MAISTAGQLLIIEGKGAIIVLAYALSQKTASRVNCAYAFPFAFTSTSEGHMLWYHENNLQVNLTRVEEKKCKSITMYSYCKIYIADQRMHSYEHP